MCRGAMGVCQFMSIGSGTSLPSDEAKFIRIWLALPPADNFIR